MRGRSDGRAAQDLSAIGDEMLARLAAFMRTLRDQSFVIGARETEDAAKVLACDLARRPRLLRQAFKALLCSNRSDWTRFDEIFDAFWLGRGVRTVIRAVGAEAASRGTDLRELARALQQHGGEPGLGDQSHGVPNEEEDRRTAGVGRMEGASRIETLAKTDFRKIHDPEAMAAAHRLAQRLAKRLRSRLTRRARAARRGRRIDLRRTIRRNIAHGGEPIILVRRDRLRKPLRLVVLLDASGSMSPYTSVFVRFVHGVLGHFREAEAFLFHTHLVHVSSALADRDPQRALDRLSIMAQGVGGGTRIGESLATFNRWHARRVIHSRTCVMILSDGYDTGPPERLAEEMRRLALRCRRIVWLNPMIGWEGYEPAARGMQAALPHVDLFAPAHTLESLAALEPWLARL